jgi:biotin carboxyl carrier protein
MDSLAEFIVSVGGRNRRARLLRIKHENTAVIELDGKAAEVAFPNLLGFDKPVSINVNGRNYRVNLGRNDRVTACNVDVDGKRFVLQLETRRKRLSNKTQYLTASPSSLPKGKKTVVQKSGAVTSLMPGKVVLLKVKIGDEIRAGDPLCVLEAMKMENEIVASRSGTVVQVKVEQGSIVDKGDVLVIIE